MQILGFVTHMRTRPRERPEDRASGQLGTYHRQDKHRHPELSPCPFPQFRLFNPDADTLYGPSGQTPAGLAYSGKTQPRSKHSQNPSIEARSTD